MGDFRCPGTAPKIYFVINSISAQYESSFICINHLDGQFQIVAAANATLTITSKMYLGIF